MNRVLRSALIAVAVLLVVPVALLIAWQRGQDGVLAGVEVSGAEVGGLDRAALDERIGDLTLDTGATPVVVTGERATVESTRAEAGARVDTAATADAAWLRGRQRNPFRAFADHVRARTGGTVEVELREEIGDDELRGWAEEAAETLSAERRDATIEFHAGDEPPGRGNRSRAEPVDPAPGVQVDPDVLVDTVRPRLQEGGRVEVEAPSETDEPVATEVDLDALLPDAREAVSDWVTLDNPNPRGEGLGLAPAALAAVLEVRTDEDAPEGQRLSLHLDSEVLGDHIGEDTIDAVEVAPRDARFVVEGGTVEIRRGRAGYTFDADAVAEEILELATSDDRAGELPGDRPRPDFTRADAEDLGIEEEVSEFTTPHACCESRVQNIQRMADIVDGVVIEPGQSFSLNGHVGPRTQENGFAAGGVIVDGEFEEEVGGGVSQFATTFFNAAFFAGIQIDDFQPHSYYISRYPAGHESTIYYGQIDVAVTNDSPYGILVKTSYTDTSVTVTFYSSEWADVEVETSGRRNVVEGDIRDGFDISFTRTITYPNGEQEVEEYFHRYEPENEDDDE